MYLQQCGYILSDAESARNALLVMLRTVKHTALDPDAGKARSACIILIAWLLYSQNLFRPEQLILEDDPSFLPELALPPPDFLAELDHNFNLDVARSGDSQTLTPFSSQQARSSSHADGIGGLILPTSSPVMAAEFRLEGDDGVGSVGGPSVMGAGDTIQLEDPDFMIADDGEIIQLPPRQKMPSTRARTAGAKMSSDAGASARVRKDHEEGQQAGDQVSFATFSHVFLHCDISLQSYGEASLLSLEPQDMETHHLTAISQAQSVGHLWLPRLVFAGCLLPDILLHLQCFYLSFLTNLASTTGVFQNDD